MTIDEFLDAFRAKCAEPNLDWKYLGYAMIRCFKGGTSTCPLGLVGGGPSSGSSSTFHANNLGIASADRAIIVAAADCSAGYISNSNTMCGVEAASPDLRERIRDVRRQLVQATGLAQL